MLKKIKFLFKCEWYRRFKKILRILKLYDRMDEIDERLNTLKYVYHRKSIDGFRRL